MNRKEIIWRIKRNNHKNKTAIKLISDFLAISKQQAESIYEEEFGNEERNV